MPSSSARSWSAIEPSARGPTLSSRLPLLLTASISATTSSGSVLYDWLAANGAGIYGSRPWRIAHEGPTQQASGMFADQTPPAWTAADWRFTTKDGALYCFCLAPAGTRELVCASLAAFDGTHQPVFNGTVSAVEQLGAGPVAFRREPDGLHIRPAARPAAQHDLPIGFRITVG